MADNIKKDDSEESSIPKNSKGDKSKAGVPGTKEVSEAGAVAGVDNSVAAPAKKRRRRRPRRKKKPADAADKGGVTKTSASINADAKSKTAKPKEGSSDKKITEIKRKETDMQLEKKGLAKEDEASKDEDVVRGAYDYVQEPQEGVYSMDESGQYLSGEGEGEADLTIGEPDEQVPPIDVGKMKDDSVGEEALMPEDTLEPDESMGTNEPLTDETVNEEELQPEEVPPDLDGEDFIEEEEIQPEEVPPELGAEESEYKSESESEEASADILSVRPAGSVYEPGPGMDSMPDAFKEQNIVEEADNTPDFVEPDEEKPEIREPEIPNYSPGQDFDNAGVSAYGADSTPDTGFERESESEVPTVSSEPGPDLEPSYEDAEKPVEDNKMGSREVIDQAETEEETELNDESEADEPKTILDSLAYVGMQIGPILARVFNIRIIVVVVVLAGLVWGGLWAYNSGIISNLFGGGGQEKESTIGGNAVIVYDSVLKENGIAGALLFGENKGSIKETIADQISLSNYFGSMLEPKVSGETGISAALYYGELMDEASSVNQYVEFVKSLDELNNLFEIDVYELLDRNTERSETLDNYLIQLKEAKDKNEKVLQLINLYLDSLKESYNSLSPDKDKFEQDFFVSLEALEAEKSDALLKSFIDVTQKQSALKARVAALETLVSYYDTALKKLDRRVDAVEKNKDALLEGIRVVEVPGGGVDVIIKPENPS